MIPPPAAKPDDDPKWGAWIKSFVSLSDHWKAKRAARLLGCSLPTIVGHLHYLWWWALEYATSGDLSRFDLPEIAEAARWDGNAADFVAALVRSEFIDNDGEDMRLHNWHKYTGDLLEKRAARAAYMKKKRAAEKADRDRHVNARADHVPPKGDRDQDPDQIIADHDQSLISDDHPDGGQRRREPRRKRDDHVTGTLPARDTLEKRREEKRREENHIYRPNGANTVYDPRFLLLWERYPRRAGKRGSKLAAYKRWYALPETDKAAVEHNLPHYAASHEGQHQPKDMSTWLGPDRHWEEWSEAETPVPPPVTNGRNGHRDHGIPDRPIDSEKYRHGKYAHLFAEAPPPEAVYDEEI